MLRNLLTPKRRIEASKGEVALCVHLGEAVFECDRFVQAWATLFHKTKLAHIIVVYKGCLQIE